MSPALAPGFFTSHTTWESHVYTQIYFKELAYGGWQVQNLHQAGDMQKSLSSSPKAICWQNSFLLRGGQFLF